MHANAKGREQMNQIDAALKGSVTPEIENAQTGGFERYTVASGDTLQKISKKFYGTTKKWKKIYEANKDTLKSPNSIFPGKALNIPSEGLREPKENLK